MPVEEQGSKKIDLLNKRQINQLYNQDIKIEDSEKTSFYYHKTLAYEFLIVVFTLITICTSLLTYFTKDTYFLTT